jgi:protein-arginine kinase activator protein McsA
LSVDLFFSARDNRKNYEELAIYRAWKSVAQLRQETDDVPLPIPAPAPIPTPVKTNSYAKYSDGELETMLNEAVAKEQFDTAEKIQTEINRRSTERPATDLSKMTVEQLQTKLTEAIQKEDYETAGKIQKELKRRETEKKETP